MSAQPPRPWRLLASRTVLDDRWLRVEAERLALPDGTVLDPYYVIDEAEWACALPVLDDGRVALVRQYRRAAGRTTLELPAGDLDPGEGPEACARRELAEETGYRALGDGRPLGCLMGDPSRNRSRGHGFLFRVAAGPGPRPDHGEDLSVEVLSVPDLLEAVDDGDFCHAAHVAFVLRAASAGHIAAGW